MGSLGAAKKKSNCHVYYIHGLVHARLLHHALLLHHAWLLHSRHHALLLLLLLLLLLHHVRVLHRNAVGMSTRPPFESETITNSPRSQPPLAARTAAAP